MLFDLHNFCYYTAQSIEENTGCGPAAYLTYIEGTLEADHKACGDLNVPILHVGSAPLPTAGSGLHEKDCLSYILDCSDSGFKRL